jgi:hypothetical protein
VGLQHIVEKADGVPRFVEEMTKAILEAGALQEALGVMGRTGEYLWEAEVYRLKGALLLQQAPPDVTGAETCSPQALDNALGEWPVGAETADVPPSPTDAQ